MRRIVFNFSHNIQLFIDTDTKLNQGTLHSFAWNVASRDTYMS